MGPRSKAQLAEALSKRNVPDDAAASVLARFTEVGLIDDAAFAVSWVESRHRGRGLARRALAQELRHKGIAEAESSAALDTLGRDQEEATARLLVDRKLRATRGLDAAARVPTAADHFGRVLAVYASASQRAEPVADIATRAALP